MVTPMTRIVWLEKIGDVTGCRDAHLTRDASDNDVRLPRQTFCGTWSVEYATHLETSALVTCVACRAAAGSRESAAGLVLVDDGIRHQVVMISRVTTHNDVVTRVPRTWVMCSCDADAAPLPLKQATPGAVDCLACLACLATPRAS